MTTTNDASTPRRRWRRISLVVGLVAALSLPVAALAGNSFTDVPNSNVFHADIEWMKETGVTRGCNPPANDKFCPEAFVTRQQMAAFMHRLETKNVFLRANAKAADANKLDGRDGTFYENPVVFRSGDVWSGTAISIQNGEIARLTIDVPAQGDVIARTTTNWLAQASDTGMTVWIEPRQVGSECDNRNDGDTLSGAYSTTTVMSDESTGNASGAGVDAGVSAGSHQYSLCISTWLGISGNIDWTASLEWRAAAQSSAALVAGAATSGADRSQLLLRE